MPTKLKGRSTPAAVAGKNGHSLISSNKFRQMYAALLQCELLEKRLTGFSPDETPSAIAAAVGLTLDLEHEDAIVLSPGTLAASFVKGVPASALISHGNAAANGAAIAFAEVNAYKPASSGSGIHVGLATGVALANKIAKNGRIAVAFLEGGAATLTDCQEALDLASKHKLPVLYVAQLELNRKDEMLLGRLAELFPVITVDAQDIVAIYRVAQESITRARDGGPTLIVCVPCTTEGVPANAVANMERYLAGKKLFESRWKDEALAQIGSELGRGLSSSV